MAKKKVKKCKKCHGLGFQWDNGWTNGHKKICKACGGRGTAG